MSREGHGKSREGHGGVTGGSWEDRTPAGGGGGATPIWQEGGG